VTHLYHINIIKRCIYRNMYIICDTHLYHINRINMYIYMWHRHVYYMSHTYITSIS